MSNQITGGVFAICNAFALGQRHAIRGHKNQNPYTVGYDAHAAYDYAFLTTTRTNDMVIIEIPDSTDINLVDLAHFADLHGSELRTTPGGRLQINSKRSPPNNVVQLHPGRVQI